MNQRRLTTPVDRQQERDSTSSWPREQRDGSARMAAPCAALAADGSEQLCNELDCLLHSRLRTASLITLCGACIFLVRELIDSSPGGQGLIWLDFLLHGTLVALLAAMVMVLWIKERLSTRSLRIIEGIVFGGIASYFIWIHYQSFCPEHGVAAWALPGRQGDVLRLAGIVSSARWFALIVIYGTFIPNTWRRSALVVGLLAAAPILTTIVAAFARDNVRDQLLPLLAETIMVVGMGSAIAVFGSYKIRTLTEEAFEARKLGQYRLRERLGVGGMGEVYLAEHRFLRRPAALKLIRPEQAGDPNTLARFEREVQTTATLTHWNTVEIYDYGVTQEGVFYYVMEYLPGLDLQMLVWKFGPLPAGRVIHLLRQVCSALREAHGVGLIHRDIKPSNIFTCERGGVHDVAKLLDFGLVHAPTLADGDERLTQQGGIAGTPLYLAPEQARAKGPIDGRADIYSLGAVAYYLLTGRPPFVRETAFEVIAAHLREPPESPQRANPEIPTDLAEIILRCLEKDPARRFPEVSSLAEALAASSAAGAWGEDQAAAWWNTHRGQLRSPLDGSTSEAFLMTQLAEK